MNINTDFKLWAFYRWWAYFVNSCSTRTNIYLANIVFRSSFWLFLFFSLIFINRKIKCVGFFVTFSMILVWLMTQWFDGFENWYFCRNCSDIHYDRSIRNHLYALYVTIPIPVDLLSNNFDFHYYAVYAWRYAETMAKSHLAKCWSINQPVYINVSMYFLDNNLKWVRTVLVWICFVVFWLRIQHFWRDNFYWIFLTVDYTEKNVRIPMVVKVFFHKIWWTFHKTRWDFDIFNVRSQTLQSFFFCICTFLSNFLKIPWGNPVPTLEFHEALSLVVDNDKCQTTFAYIFHITSKKYSFFAWNAGNLLTLLWN